jgi:hypothetical protein
MGRQECEWADDGMNGPMMMRMDLQRCKWTNDDANESMMMRMGQQ